MGSSNDGAKAAKSKRASVSEKGGLLNRMFGSSSPPKDETSGEELKRTTTEPMPQLNTSNDGAGSEPDTPTGRRSEEMVASPNSDKRSRRSSGIQKAKDMFSGARSAMSNSSPSREQRSSQTPIQKLGKTDPALSVPQGSLNNAAGESVPGPRSTFRVGVTEDKNKKCRRTMEDTHAYLYNFLSTPAPVLSQDHRNQLARVSTDASVASGTPVVESDNGYFAIFDGHAGTFAAEWCGKKLHLLLEETIRRNPNKAIPELLDETFTNVDQQLEKLPLKNSGCTAVTAVLRWEDRIPNSQSATGSTSIAPAAAAAASKEGPDASAVQADGAPPPVEAKIRENASRQRVLYTANVGDARIVLCRNGKALRLSYDHKGSDDNEGKRIANAGGLILNNRVNGVLAVTRALGDAYMKDLVTGHPYTTETVIQPDIDEFLILACDGLWDVCTDQEAVDLIRQTNDPQSASKQLVDHALARFSTDNLSCMVIRFDARAVAETIASRNEPIGVEGDAATKIRGGITESAAIVGQARRTMEGVADSGSDAGGSFSPTTGRASGDLSRLDSKMVQETEEEAQEQEPGPELDPKGLEKAREKAEVGQEKVQGLTPTTSQAQTLGSQSGGEGLAPTQSAPTQPTPPTQSQVASEGVREGPYMGGSGGS